MAYSNPYGSVITQVSLPFTSPVPGGMVNEKQIQIQGIVHDSPAANGFSINLCEGMKLEPNCVLHFNPRFHQGCIVRNALQDGNWGPEERDGGMPIVKGQPFEVIIMCGSTGYFVAVNGRHFTEFKHRMPMTMAKYLFIDGSYLKINFIKYEGGGMPAASAGGFVQPPVPGFAPSVAPPPYSAGGFALPGMGAGEEMMSHKKANGTIFNPPIPLNQRIPGKMVPGRMIYISAVPRPDAERFAINLENKASGNINFHFDVRIHYGSDRNVVVRNTCINGNWGAEERDATYFPFSPNATFDMLILAEGNQFKVAINNAHYIAYFHRQPLKMSDTLTISGGVRVTSLRFQ